MFGQTSTSEHIKEAYEAEDYQLFYNRGRAFLKTLQSHSSNALLVGTRSILICLVSILLGRTIEAGGGYREIPMKCCDFFAFSRSGPEYVFDPFRSRCVLCGDGNSPYTKG